MASGPGWSSLLVSAVGWGCVSLGVLLVASRFSPAAANAVFKLRLLTHGAAHFTLSRDKSWRELPDADAVLLAAAGGRPPPRTKRFVFIRHGESEWNEIFNKGLNPSFLLRLGRGLAREFVALPSRSSVFFDANLNAQGVAQAQALAERLEIQVLQDRDVATILQPVSQPPTSVVTCSNLRRSIATGLLALRRRLEKTGEKIVVHSALQEITFNVDGLALAVPNGAPDMSQLHDAFGPNFRPSAALDTTFNQGSKSLKSNGLERMLQFNHWAFERPEDVIIVAGGHSIWFRSFFQTFLPKSVDHPSKRSKLSNCGCVVLDVAQATVGYGDLMYRIDPASLRVIAGGFS